MKSQQYVFFCASESVFGTSKMTSHGRKFFLRDNRGKIVSFWVSSVQFSRSVVSNCLRPHESQHARPPCPSPKLPSLPKLTSIESVMPSSRLILCCPLLLLPPIPPSISRQTKKILKKKKKKTHDHCRRSSVLERKGWKATRCSYLLVLNSCRNEEFFVSTTDFTTENPLQDSFS